MARSVTRLDRAKRLVHQDRHGELRNELTACPRLLTDADRDGQSLLHYAASKDKLDCLRALIDAGGDPNSRSKLDGSTPLHCAAENGSIRCIEFLVQRGVDLFAKTEKTAMTACDVAARKNMTRCREYLESEQARFLKRQRDMEQQRMLDFQQACTEGDLQTVKDILSGVHDKGALVFADGTNPLYRACLGGHQHIADYLIKECFIRRWLPHMRTKETPLHACAYNGSIELANLLLVISPEMSVAISENKETALHIASRNGHVNLVRLLLTGRAILKTNSTESLAELLKLPVGTENSSGATESLDPNRVVKFPVVDVNAVCTMGRTSLLFASDKGNADIVELLLSKRDENGQCVCKVDIASEVGETALHLACANNNTRVAGLLLKAGADMNAVVREVETDDQGPMSRAVTPLVMAAGNGGKDTARLLLEYGATDGAGDAIQAAQQAGRSDIVQLIVSFTGVEEDRDVMEEEKSKLEKKARLAGISPPELEKIFLSIKWNNLQLSCLEMPFIQEGIDHFLVRHQIPGQKVLYVTTLELMSNKLTKLPDELFHLPLLRKLHATRNLLQSLPGDKKHWQCSQLQEIKVSFNELTSIPVHLFSLKQLKIASFIHNQIAELPWEMWTAPVLEKLFLYKNEIKQLPALPSQERFSPVSDDRKADRNDSGATSCASSDRRSTGSGGSRTSRQTLKRFSTQMEAQRRLNRYQTGSTLMPRLDESTHPEKASRGLKVLDVGRNQLTSLPRDLACLAPRLTRLIAKENHISSVVIPRGLPVSLETADFDNNELIDFCASQEPLNGRCSRQAFGLPELTPGVSLYSPAKQQDCSHCQHKTLPHLRTLLLGNNKLDEVSFNLSYPDVVRTPRENEKRTSLPAAHSRTSDKSEEEDLPAVICPILGRLYLHSNRFCSVPDSVCKLDKLKGLHLSDNKGILHLPLEMGRLNGLYDLFLDGLALVDPPPHIIQQRTGDIIGFLRQRLKQSMPYRRLKLMLVGRHKKGKTSLLEQLIQQGHNSGHQSYWSHVVQAQRGITPSTNGIDIVEWSLVRRTLVPIRETKVTFMVWDFGGQEEYYATHQCFLSRRSLYLAVWSMADGMEGIEDLGRWLLTIEARAPSSSVIIVCTFLDSCPERDRKALCNKYKQELVHRYGIIGHVKAGYPVIRRIRFVSAIKNDRLMSKLRDEIFQTACELEEQSLRGYAVNPKAPVRRLLDQQVPAGFIQVEERAMEVAKDCQDHSEVPVLRAVEFKERVMSHDHVTLVDKESEDEIGQAVQFLHENGILLHFDDSSLSDYYFLSPQWLCDMLAHIVTIKATNACISADGILPLSKFPQIFRSSQFPVSLQSCYLDLLDKFEVAVLIDEDNLLVPSRLPDELTQVQWRDTLVNGTVLPLHRHYTMPYIPHGMWPRLISRILGDKKIKEVITNQLPQNDTSQQGALKWHAWKKGIELRWNKQPILRLKETAGAIFSFPRFDPALVRLTVCEHPGVFGDVIQSSHDVGVQLWISSNPRKACESNDPEEVADEGLTASDTVDTYSQSTSRRYSIKAVDEFEVIEVEDDFQQAIGGNTSRQSHDTKSSSRDHGYETSYDRRQNDMSQSLSIQPRGPGEADRLRSESLLSSASSLHATSRPDPLAVELLTRCVSHMDAILQDWYHGLRDYDTYTFCPDCLQATLQQLELSNRLNSQSVEICLFSWKAAVRQAYCHDTIDCSKHQNVPLTWIVPDALFGDLPASSLILPTSLKQNHPLGKGGFSDVWQGQLIRQGQQTISVALKLLIKGIDDISRQTRGPTTQAVQLSQFLDALPTARAEVSFLLQLNHPSIVQMLGVCLRPLCVVIELAPLGSLDKVLETYVKARCVIDARSSSLAALQVANALDYLHTTMNVIYRDLKSDNILVWKFPRPNSSGESSPRDVLVKLSDYGISQWANPKGRAKGFGGTEGYIAPEVYRHHGRETFTTKIDIFSYAMVLYELITLQPPMKDIQGDELERAYLSDKRPSMSREHMDCRIFLRELMFWCWQQNPQDRPTAAEIVTTLESSQFLRLIGGLPATENSENHCAAVHCRKVKAAGGFGQSDADDGKAFNEVWICSGDKQLGKLTVVSKHDRELEQEDFSVCDSCIYCVCAVNETMWIGTENGHVYVFLSDERKEVAKVLLTEERRDPVMCMIHSSTDQHVIVGMGSGNIHLFSDEVSLSDGTDVATRGRRMRPMKSIYLVNRIVSCLALIPLRDKRTGSSVELWCGLTFGEIAVLDSNTLESKCDALKVVPEKKQTARAKVHNMVIGIVSHLAINDGETGVVSSDPHRSFVFCSLTRAGVVIKLLTETREKVGEVNVAGFLNDGEKSDEYKFVVTSLYCFCDRLFVGTRSGHIVVIDSDSLSVVSTFHGFCENVVCLFSLPKSSWSLLPAVSGHTVDADDASLEPSSLTPYLVSIGTGLQSYEHGQQDNSATGFVLLWNVNSL